VEGDQEKDEGYHVKGALVVAPDCALQYTLDLLRKVVDELCDYPIFVVSPITRYIRGPCCNAEDHVTNFRDPDFLPSILSGHAPWQPNRSRGFNRGRDEPGGRGRGEVRGRGNDSGGHFPRGRGRPWRGW
jgi:hypothetical protein